MGVDEKDLARAIIDATPAPPREVEDKSAGPFADEVGGMLVSCL